MMNKIFYSGLFLLLQASLAHAAPDLIKMASEGDFFLPDFVQAMAGVFKEEINQTHDAAGRTMLHILAARSHQARLLVPLLAGADVNVKDGRGRTPLFDNLAANDPNWEGNADFMILEMLTARGADLNARADDGTTPLAVSVAKGDYRKAEFLLWRGASLNPTGVPPEKNPVSIAHAKGDQRMIALLETTARMDAGTSQAASPKIAPRSLSAALTAADLNAIDELRASGWNINEQDARGQTALFRATSNYRADLASLLIFDGADPNLAANDGTTPLMVSLRVIAIEPQRITALLLLKGADINAVNKKGETALTTAAAASYDFGVQWLVAAGANLLAPTPKGSVTDYCTHGPTLWVLKQLGAPARRAQAPETDPVQLMFEAARRGDVAGVERELKNGTPVDVEDKVGNTAFRWAANWDQFEVVDLLLRYGANINRQSSKRGWHLLHNLAEWGGKEGDAKIAAALIEKLVSRGANLNLQMEDGTTPLMAAAKEGVTGANTHALLKAGANINLRNKEGLTALGVAQKFGRVEMADFLKAHGALE